MRTQKALSASPALIYLLTLQGHTNQACCAEWSPDGQTLASGSYDNTIRLWDPRTGDCPHILRGHSGGVNSIAWAPDGRSLVSGSYDSTVRLWNAVTGELRHTFLGHEEGVHSVVWSPDGSIVASGSADTTIRLWNVESAREQGVLRGHTSWVNSVAWSPDGQMLASGSGEGVLWLWDTVTWVPRRKLQRHREFINEVVWSNDGHTLVSASGDYTVRLWHVDESRQNRVLEGHTGWLVRVRFSCDGRLLASLGQDALYLWRCATGESLLRREGPFTTQSWLPLAFHPKDYVLATPSENRNSIDLWQLHSVALGETQSEDGQETSVYYTNAKVVLVGDSGVGKSGLSLVLTGQSFAPTDSTHGRHVWTFDSREVTLPEAGKEIRETLLWDMAGQPGYRLVHQLHLNEVTLALIVFDARSDTDPFAGVRHWQRALRQAQHVQGDDALPLKIFLVAARVVLQR